MPNVKRVRWKFGLRAVLLLVLVLAAALASWSNHASRQRRAVLLVQELGGWVRYDFDSVIEHRGASITIISAHDPNSAPNAPPWLVTLLGTDYFAQVTAVWLADTAVSHAHLRTLGSLEDLRFLKLTSTRISDESLDDLARFEHLESLDIMNTSITARGAEQLRQLLPGCRVYH